MYGYIAIYGDKQIEVYASDMGDAKRKAVALFKVKPSREYMVSVYLCEVNGKPIVHTADF